MIKLRERVSLLGSSTVFLLALQVCSSQRFGGGWSFPNVMVPQPPSQSFLPRFQDQAIDEEILNAFSTSTKEVSLPQPEVKSLHIVSKIANRYAHTTMNSRVANPANVSQEVKFSVIIPETAFITGFIMEIDGKAYKAYVKEKEEAKREYNDAVHRGQAAAHVHQSARDSERFSVSVNVEAQSKVTFTLTYEELLQRELGIYRHVININPGQIVPDMKVDVHIKELKNITDLHAKEIQSANEIDSNVAENPNAQVEWIGGNEAKVHFEADEKEQRRLEKLRKSGKEGSGVSGKFVIDYDVDRDPSGGQVIVNDGYFVHFFSPTDLPPLRKHVLFVLDVSGSMSGRKIEQLRDAMLAILDELKPDDVFNIIEFSYSVTVRNLDAEVNSAVYTPYHQYYSDYFQRENQPPVDEKTEPFPATPHYIEKAKSIIRKMTAGGGTNIYDALKTALKISKKGVSNDPKSVADIRIENSTDEALKDSRVAVKEERKQAGDTPQPIIFFLTDGEPTVGETSLRKIQEAVNEFNDEPKATIFSLAFGEGADFQFLKKISLANNGFARHIYEAADAQIQLSNFYKQISSPLLSDVKFVYPPGQVDDKTITKRKFSNLFHGSEIVIAGKIGSGFNAAQVEAIALDGPIDYQIPIPEVRHTPELFGSLERLWAYITIRQLLDQDAVESNNVPKYSDESDGPVLSTEKTSTRPTPKEQALKIALKACWEGLKSCFEQLIIGLQFVLLFLKQLIIDFMSSDYVYIDQSSLNERIKLGHRDRALEIAIKYSFVCPLTSLVVVKPNGTSDLNTESASPGEENGAPMGFQSFAVAAFAPARRPGSFGPLSGGQSFYTTRPSMPMAPMAHILPMATTLNYVPQSPPFDRVDSIEEDAETVFESDKIDPAESEIPWLKSLRDGNQLELNTTEGDKKFNLVPSQNPDESQPCQVDGVEGTCRVLINSATEAKKISLEDYVSKYFCQLPGDVAGMCHIPTVDETTTAPVTENAAEQTTAAVEVEQTVPVTEQVEAITEETTQEDITISPETVTNTPN